MVRIVTRAIPGFAVGDIADRDWDSLRASLAQHHGITDPVDSYTIPLEEAARRYVASLQRESAPRGRARVSDAA